EDQLLEWANVYGQYYGTPMEPVLNAVNQGKDVILEIDVQGAFLVRKKFPTCVLIFLIPPSRLALEKRLKNRATDSDEEIEQRLKWAESEIQQVAYYDYLIINDEVEKAAYKVVNIINAERCRPALLDIESLMNKYRV
ncbi:MAG: guanylate kinase, partial [Desulfotomaculaceae bacterium]